jgi:ketosteroid isomerase-like protein
MTMSKRNVEAVRRGIEAFNRRDLDGLLREMHPDAELDWSRSRGLRSGIYRGKAEIKRFWEELFDHFEEINVRPERFIEAGEHVVVPDRSFARGRAGIRVEAANTMVFTLRDGKLVRQQLFQETEEALEAVGLSEQDAHADS